MTKTKRKNKPLSFYPLKPEDVLKELLKIKPEKKNQCRGKNNANRRKN